MHVGEVISNFGAPVANHRATFWRQILKRLNINE